MDDIAEQLAIRDRFARQRWAMQTPEERWSDLDRLQASTWEMLRRPPAGYAQFIGRNFKACATDWVVPDVV